MDLNSYDCAPSRLPVNDWRRMDSVEISNETETKTFKSETKTFASYFNSGKKFIIPAFQRGYSWDYKNVIKLIQDAMKQKDREHFIGAFIVADQGNNELIVIDGQQRLTSILLILCAIRDCFYNIEDESKPLTDEELQKIKEYIDRRIEDNNLNDALTEDMDILLAGTRRKDYEKFFQEVKYNKKNYNTMLSTYRQIYNFILGKNKNYIKTLHRTVMSLTFTEISSSGILDAYYVFRTLNSSGVSLRPNDHIKAHIFSHLDVGNDKEGWNVAVDKSYINKWNKIKDNVEYDLDKNSIDTFMGNFARVNGLGSRVSRDAPHEVYFSSINDGDKSQDVLKLMVEDSKIYHNIVNPDVKDKLNHLHPVLSDLKFLKSIGIRQHVQLVYAACKLKDAGKMSLKQLRSLTTFLAKFHFIYNTLSKERGNKVTPKYTKYSKKFVEKLLRENSKESVDKIIKDLKDDFKGILKDKPSIFENARSKFYNLDYAEDISLIGYVLQFCFPKVFHYGDETTEHVVAQSTGRENVDKIGNLIFLTRRDNEDVNALPVSKKVNEYINFKYISEDFMKIIEEYKDTIEDNSKFDEFRRKMANKMFAIFTSDLGYEDPDEYRKATTQTSARNVPIPGKDYDHYTETIEDLRLMMDDWLDAYNFGIQTGNFSYAKKYLPSDIEECDTYKEIEELYRRGGWIVNGLYSFESVDISHLGEESGSHKVKMHITREYAIYCEPNKTNSATKKAHTVDLTFICKYDNGFWKVLHKETE